MKDVLVHSTIRSDSALENAARYALDFAASQGARVTAFLSEVEPRSAPFAPPDNMQGELRARVEPSRAEEAERIASLLRSTGTGQGVRCEIFVSDFEGQTAAAQLARLASVRDLVVMSTYGPLQYPRLAFAQAVLFGAGGPLMLIPRDAGSTHIRTAMIAWDATRSATRAFRDAMPLLAMANEVIVVTVLGDKVLQPEESGEEVCRALNYRNIPARFEAIQDDAADVGATLLQAAARVQAELLVMGGFAHSLEREFLLGSATRSLFGSNVSFPVLLSH